MRYDVITLFPELFGPHLSTGITRRAFEGGQVEVRLWPLRDFAEDAYRRVDDRPFGGGPGMVMLVQPLERALAAVRAERGDDAPIIHFTPTGLRMDQALVQRCASGPGAVLLCGRYEGIDQRFLDRHDMLEVSLGCCSERARGRQRRWQRGTAARAVQKGDAWRNLRDG